MHSFLKGVRRTGKSSTNRNPAKTLALVVHQPEADTPANGVPAIPRSVRPEAVEAAQHRAPLVAGLPATPVITQEGSRYRHTAPLRHLPVPSPEQVPSTAPLSARLTEGAREMAQQGVNAVFRALPWATEQKIMSQMERRDRVVFLLLDGRRSIRDIAYLIHRDELDIARTLVRLLKYGYIEPVAALL